MFVRLKRAFLLSACIVAAENGNLQGGGGRVAVPPFSLKIRLVFIPSE